MTMKSALVVLVILCTLCSIHAQQGTSLDPEFDFDIFALYSAPDVNTWDSNFGASNEVGPFEFDLEGYAEEDGFTVSINGACRVPKGNVGGTTGSGLAKKVILINPTVGYISETWCINIELFLPLAGVPQVVAKLEYELTVNVQTSGIIRLTDSAELDVSNAASYFGNQLADMDSDNGINLSEIGSIKSSEIDLSTRNAKIDKTKVSESGKVASTVGNSESTGAKVVLNKFFEYVVQISKRIMYEICYYALGIQIYDPEDDKMI